MCMCTAVCACYTVQLYVHVILYSCMYMLYCTAVCCDWLLSRPSGDAALQLSKYLLRTVCTDILNMVICYVSKDKGVQLPDGEKLTAKVICDMCYIYILLYIYGGVFTLRK